MKKLLISVLFLTVCSFSAQAQKVCTEWEPVKDYKGETSYQCRHWSYDPPAVSAPTVPEYKTKEVCTVETDRFGNDMQTCKNVKITYHYVCRKWQTVVSKNGKRKTTCHSWVNNTTMGHRSVCIRFVTSAPTPDGKKLVYLSECAKYKHGFEQPVCSVWNHTQNEKGEIVSDCDDFSLSKNTNFPPILWTETQTPEGLPKQTVLDSMTIISPHVCKTYKTSKPDKQGRRKVSCASFSYHPF